MAQLIDAYGLSDPMVGTGFDNLGRADRQGMGELRVGAPLKQGQRQNEPISDFHRVLG